MSHPRGWHFWIDRGGTFTDIVGRRPDGSLVTHKVLSTSDAYQDAGLQGISELLGVPPGTPLPVHAIARVHIGTTVATNALLVRSGPPLALLVTRGFGDVLRIGHQTRPRIFARRIDRPATFYTRVLEVDERIDADGSVHVPLDEPAVARALAGLVADGIHHVAIVFLHAYANPDHERRAGALAKAAGCTTVSLSHDVSSRIKVVDRGHTTVVDAYLSSIVRGYVAEVARALEGVPTFFMQSNGGLVAGAGFRGVHAILSGPAAGVVGAAATARLAGMDRVIGFDMGGTSTDVSHYAGALEHALETHVAGLTLQVPSVLVHTVAAGGGSILGFDGGRFLVGPSSAGATPGPASYGRGGPLTITDCNLLVGKLVPAHLPPVFGDSGQAPLDRAAVETAFDRLTAEVNRATGDGRSARAVAHGFLDVAVANMAAAIRKISTERGFDPSIYGLACFGGAGPQHACLVADALGMSSVVIHPLAGVLSAYGIGLADERLIRERSIELPLSGSAMVDARRVWDELEADARHALDETGGRPVVVRRRAHLRYLRSENPLVVDAADESEMRASFERLHRDRFGFDHAAVAVIVAAVSVEATRPAAVSVSDGAPSGASDNTTPLRPIGHTPIYTVTAGGESHASVDAPIFRRADFGRDHLIDGPALIVEPHTTTVVEPGWRGRIGRDGVMRLSRVVARSASRASTTAVDPVRLAIMSGLFMAVAERMGTTLELTAQSVNIRERRDFSCAVFDAAGQLIANAPHIPVHLGSMGDSVTAIIEKHRESMRPGDAFLVNAPYAGGTHLPDLTVVAPVFDEAGAERLYYVAARGHHADVGGITPGSMPPLSRSVDEEGVVFDGMLVRRNGRLLEADVRARLQAGPFPARNIDQNIADLEAQLAAVETGCRGLRDLVARYGRPTVDAYMGHVQDHAEALVRRAILRLDDGVFTYGLDSGARVQVAVTVDRIRGEATVDFSGTSPQLPSNFNAPLAVTKAAVLYVFRTLLDEDIPLNAGCFRPLHIVVPPGSLLNPRPPAAVVAGNVETSQVVVDALMGALGVMAASQGTMNNLTFGNGTWQYYETIAGGAGAGPDFDGQSGVHTHMTNSRITDPEVLEARCPVRVDRFGLRAGSGGTGRHRGGDGLVRRVTFREAMTVAILANRRVVPPFGVAGGAPGALGSTRIERADGRVETLASADLTRVLPGDAVLVETPGGGGFGPPGTALTATPADVAGPGAPGGQGPDEPGGR